MHVHGASSWVGGADGRPSVYSHPSAPGVIMAAGNTGNHLEFDADFQCTWLSRDGGYTWEDVAHGMFIYEYGDHGGLVVMGRHRNEGVPTDTLYYSYDQGLCWHSVKLGEAMYLENIRVEPAGASHTFILHGEQCEKDTRWTSQGFNCTYVYGGEDSPKGVLYQIDFQDIRRDWNTCLKDDYEDWSPPTPDLCLLGRNFTYQRRKRKSECFNSKEYERPIDSRNCGCSNKDVECDYGYTKNADGISCDRIEEIAEQRRCPALIEGYGISPSHKRLIHGDACDDITGVISAYTGIEDYKPFQQGLINYPRISEGRRFGAGKFLVVTVLLLGSLGLAFYSWLKCFASEDTREAVLETLDPLTSYCCGCLSGTKSRLGMAATSSNPKHEFFRPLAGEENDNGLDYGYGDDRESGGDALY